MADFSAFLMFSADQENRFTINKQALGASNRNKQELTLSKSNLDDPKILALGGPDAFHISTIKPFWNK